MTADGNGFVDAAEAKTWWDFLDGLKISYVNWAMDAKDEKSAALTPGSGSAQVGDSSRWTESGKLVNARLKTQNNGRLHLRKGFRKLKTYKCLPISVYISLEFCQLIICFLLI